MAAPGAAPPGRDGGETLHIGASTHAAGVISCAASPTPPIAATAAAAAAAAAAATTTPGRPGLVTTVIPTSSVMSPAVPPPSPLAAAAAAAAAVAAAATTEPRSTAASARTDAYTAAAAASNPLSRYEVCARLMMDQPPELSRDAGELDAIVVRLQRGAHLLKFSKGSKPQRRFVCVTEGGESLCWLSRRKRLADSTSA